MNKDLLYSTVNSTQYLEKNLKKSRCKKKKKRVDEWICITDSLCCTSEINIIVNCTPIKMKNKYQ